MPRLQPSSGRRFFLSVVSVCLAIVPQDGPYERSVPLSMQARDVKRRRGGRQTVLQHRQLLSSKYRTTPPSVHPKTRQSQHQWIEPLNESLNFKSQTSSDQSVYLQFVGVFTNLFVLVAT
jgi:hypothetical protein